MYAQQFNAVVSRCIQTRINEGVRYEDLSFGEFTGYAVAVSLAIEFLEGLAFSCQVQLETRDFKVEASSDLNGWEHGLELYCRIRDLLFQTIEEVGLVTTTALRQQRLRMWVAAVSLATLFSLVPLYVLAK